MHKSATMCTVDLENDMSCCLCNEEFNTYDRHARMLPCGDTFCFVCIVHLHEGTGLKSVTCPYCCEFMELDSGDVHDLPEDEHIMCFVEHRIVTNSSGNKAFCQKHEKEADTICWTCKEVLCTKCHVEEAIKNKKHAKHDIANLQELFEDSVKGLQKYTDLNGFATDMTGEAGIMFHRRTADLRERLKVIMTSLEQRHIHAIADAQNLLQELHSWEIKCSSHANNNHGCNGEVKTNNHDNHMQNQNDNHVNHKLQKALDLKKKSRCAIQ